MSYYDKYQESYSYIEISVSGKSFGFSGTGPLGEIRKMVHFMPTVKEKLYYLLCSDMLKDGSIMHTGIVTDNNTARVPATLAMVISLFLKRYETASVLITIDNRAEEMQCWDIVKLMLRNNEPDTFKVWGLTRDLQWEPYTEKVHYKACIIRKNIEPYGSQNKQAETEAKAETEAYTYAHQ